MGRQNQSGLRQAFRLSLVEDDSHKTLGTVRFSRLGMTVGIVTAVVLLVGLIWCLISFTPLRTTIPGYPDENSRHQAVANAIAVDSLETVISRWELYTDNLSRALSGELTLDADSLAADMPGYLTGISMEEARRRDSLLRDMVTREERFEISSSSGRNLPLEGMHFFTPVKGVVSLAFDAVMHKGIEISAPAGSVVKAALDGTVVFSGWTDEGEYTLLIQHASDLLTVYRHNENLLCQVGDKVLAGTPVSVLGPAGTSDTGRLGFEIWSKGGPVDPAAFLGL